MPRRPSTALERRVVAVDLLDVLLADRLVDGDLVGDDVLLEADALLGDDVLLHHGTLLVEGHLVLLLGDGRTIQGVAPVGVGDRFADDAGLLALDGHRRVDVLCRDVLAQARTARLAGLRPDAELLLGAGHRVVGHVAGDIPVAAGRSIAARAGVADAGRRSGRLVVVVVAALVGGVREAVVLVELLLLLLGELGVGLELGSRLHLLLVVRDPDVVTGHRRLLQREQRQASAEQARLDGAERRLSGLAVLVDVIELADLVAVVVDDVGARPALDLFHGGHVGLPLMCSAADPEWEPSLTDADDVSMPEQARDDVGQSVSICFRHGAGMVDPSAGARRPRTDASQNRIHILKTGGALLTERPRATMSEVAVAAHVSRGTLYRHFPTRGDLLEAINREAYQGAVASQGDGLLPAGELARAVPTPLSIADVLNKVPPHLLGDQVVAEAQRIGNVSSAAIYLVDLDGVMLKRLAGPPSFPLQLPVPLAVGTEIPLEGLPGLQAVVDEHLPGAASAPLLLRGRAIGTLVAVGSSVDELYDLAYEAAAALALAGIYTDSLDAARRVRATRPGGGDPAELAAPADRPHERRDDRRQRAARL